MNLDAVEDAAAAAGVHDSYGYITQVMVCARILVCALLWYCGMLIIVLTQFERTAQL